MKQQSCTTAVPKNMMFDASQVVFNNLIVWMVQQARKFRSRKISERCSNTVNTGLNSLRLGKEASRSKPASFERFRKWQRLMPRNNIIHLHSRSNKDAGFFKELVSSKILDIIIAITNRKKQIPSQVD
jgi:hypothetical protein